jgi:phosphate transport system substrate-binding protein
MTAGAAVSHTTKFPDKIGTNDLKVKTAPSPQLVIGGSSFDGPLVQAAQTQWGLDSSKNTSSIALYSITKSGTGRADAISGAYSIGFSDFPLNQVPGSPDVGPGSPNPSLSVANFTTIPVALGGVAIIYHFGAGVSGSFASCLKTHPLTLTGAETGKIFAGKITNWDDSSIEATNKTCADIKGVNKLPNLPIVVLSRTSGSGTTFGFKDYLSQVDHADFAAPDANAFTVAAATYANSGLLDSAVHSTNGAIGYVEYGYAQANGVTTISIVNKSGKAVQVSETGLVEAATVGLAAIAKSSCHGFNTNTLACFEINNEAGTTVYPIALFSFAILYTNQTGHASSKNAAVAEVKFLDFLAHQGGGKTLGTTFGQDLADANGYAPMPATVQTVARNVLLHVTYGGAAVLNATN